MSMALEETPVRPRGQRVGIDVYHSTCEPSIPTATLGSDLAGRPQTADAGAKAAVAAYHRALEEKCIGGFRFLRLLGQGGQGKVFLCRCPGADGFSRVVALKLFSPEAYPTLDSYQEAMRRIARVATRVAYQSHNHVVDVQRFLKRGEIRIMLMERVEGFDLRRLLQSRMLERFRQRAPEEDWIKTNQIVVTAGPEQSRILPGAAVTIVRDCLEGLQTLHVMGVVHGDLRPANLMVQPDGSTKIIDLGSAVVQGETLRERVFTPAYAAPEVLESKDWTPQSDLASLGYVLLELLTGRRLFAAGAVDQAIAGRKTRLAGQGAATVAAVFLGQRAVGQVLPAIDRSRPAAAVWLGGRSRRRPGPRRLRLFAGTGPRQAGCGLETRHQLVAEVPAGSETRGARRWLRRNAWHRSINT